MRKPPRWLALRELAGGRADLLAEVAGILEGTSEGELDEPLPARPRWTVPQGRGRPGGDHGPGSPRGGAGGPPRGRPPFSGGLHGGGQRMTAGSGVPRLDINAR